jgi:formate dehydrogenase gamma subunit
MQRLENKASLGPQSELDRYLGTAHHNLSCVSCHPGARPERHASRPTSRQCLDCHGSGAAIPGLPAAPVVRQLHPRVSAASPACETCHGHHGIARPDDRNGLPHWSNVPRLCGKCHVKPDLSQTVPQVAGYVASVHGQAALSGKPGLRPAVCTDCHTVHGIDRAPGATLRPARADQPAICGRCHPQKAEQYAGSIHGQAVAHGVQGAPVCSDCHSEHNILPPTEAESSVSSQRVVQTCGRCHANQGIVHLYKLPQQRVSSYRRSYHGIANEYGNIRVANCVSCHGAHDILPAKARASHVNPAHLATTCGRCHPGAGTAFPIGKVHLVPSVRQDWPLYLLSLFYQIFVYATILGFVVYALLDSIARYRLWRKGADEAFERDLEKLPAPPEEALIRMSRYERMEHYAQVFSFAVLAFTGLALVFPDTAFARTVIALCGGMSGRAIMHRLAAVVLVGSSLAHMAWVSSTARGRSVFSGLLPRWSDFQDAWQTGLWLTTMRERGPCFGRFSFLEKFEYFALLWGTVIMTLTGALMTFVNWSLAHFPKWVLDASSIIHRWEAILAVGAIGIYHLYHVVWRPGVFPGNPCWITGKIRPEEYIRDHPLDYAEAVGWLPGKTARTSARKPASLKPHDKDETS